MTRKVQYALIGAGAAVRRMHDIGIEKSDNEVIAVCDVLEDRARKAGAHFNCPWYTDYRQLLDEVRPEAVVIIAQHKFHADIAIAALRAGAHVLCEKPMGLHTAEADAMNEAAAEAGRLLAINYQQRTRPELVAAKRIIESGQLGQIQHVDVKTTWTRAAAYYKANDWRGSWNGEGGALLMNQTPHDLDLICWLVGMPARVHAWAPTIFHDITPADTVQAMMQWPGGAMGSFHASTAEGGKINRFEIIGTGGVIEINKGELRFARFDQDLYDFLPASPEAFSHPGIEEVETELGPETGSHVDTHRNFCNAILHGEALVADGLTAIRGLELANGMIASHYSGQTIDFPLDRDDYFLLLRRLQREERNA